MSLTRLLTSVLLPGLSLAATRALFDPASPAAGPYPTDFPATFDPPQRTGLRLNLPAPDCASRRTDCPETALLDQADRFGLRARVQARFSAPVALPEDLGFQP